MDVTNITESQIAGVCRHVNHYGAESPYAGHLAAYVRDVLEGAGDEEEWGSTKLLEALEAEPVEGRQCRARLRVPKGTVMSALRKLRSAGLLSGCWDYHPDKRYMGKPVIVWTAPGGSRPFPIAPEKILDLPPLTQE